MTGAASGIGRGLANQFVPEGMRVVLADVEEGALTDAEKELRNEGADVIAVVTDVSDRSSVDAPADAASSAYGASRPQ